MQRLYAASCLIALLAGCASGGPVTGDSVLPEGLFANGAVAADHEIASQAGAEMLRLGGNAVDAAVATSFALSVVRPYSCGIGGGGFMVIHRPARDDQPEFSTTLTYREMCPAAVGPDYFINLQGTNHGDIASRYGIHAAGVPGTVAGLLFALDRYGTLDRATVLAPAIRAAEDGWIADADHVGATRTLLARLEEYPHLREQASSLVEHLALGGAVDVGDRISNPDQARALRLIAERGVSAFYHGEIADAIVQAMQQHGGPITREDLQNYQVRERPPLESPAVLGRYRLLSMPPPSSGGIAMQQIFGLLDRRLGDFTHGSPSDAPYLHALTEAMKHAFADRAEFLADDAFVEVPTERLTSAAYLDDLAGRIDPDTTLDPSDYGSVAPAPIDGGTSHFSIIDSDGMAVACTETINLTFGSMIVVPGFGFMLNDEMDDFTTIPGEPNAFGLTQSDRNLPEPGKRPLSSMSPTIVLRNGRAAIVAGASGGPRIITGTTQGILNCIVFGMSAQEAVDAGRIHHQWLPDTLHMEGRWGDAAPMDALRARGHDVNRGGTVGVVQLIRITPDGIEAASDPRKGGRPAGY